jgi:hypothetical protein
LFETEPQQCDCAGNRRRLHLEQRHGGLVGEFAKFVGFIA